MPEFKFIEPEFKVEQLSSWPRWQPDSQKDLRSVHPLYGRFREEWEFLYAAYQGSAALVDLEKIERHERESPDGWTLRKKEIYGFGYTKSIVDLFTFYLFKKAAIRDMGTLQTDPFWNAFNNDCNLYGDPYDAWLTEQGRYASIFGHVGILVDKPDVLMRTRAEERRGNFYPYVSAFYPLSILDWKFERDDTRRPKLIYLKLKSDDGKYHLWWPDAWQVWREKKEKENSIYFPSRRENAQIELVDEGENPLGVIPFVWLYNLQTPLRPIGRSDVHEVSRIDTSIIRNLSSIEQMIGIAGFPIILKPKKPEGVEQDDAAPASVWEFDPENPNSKPEWLQSEIAAPLKATLEFIDHKKEEIYRAANTGGTTATDIRAAESGVALSIRFQLLNSRLAQKAALLERAEKEILKYWLMWQGDEQMYDTIKIKREREYDVENLAQDLDNFLKSLSTVSSNTFRVNVQKAVVRKVLPGMKNDDLQKTDEEIETAPEHHFLPRETARTITEEEDELRLTEAKARIAKTKAETEAVKEKSQQISSQFQPENK